MASETAPQESNEPVGVQAAIATGTRMRLAMPVMGNQGMRIGTLEAWDNDPLTGRLTGLTVRHGFFGRKYTRVPTGDLAGVNDGMLMLAHSRKAFKQLPGCGAPERRK
jgi:sporulation protein YlmC with PRC-barrel domain